MKDSLQFEFMKKLQLLAIFVPVFHSVANLVMNCYKLIFVQQSVSNGVLPETHLLLFWEVAVKYWLSLLVECSIDLCLCVCECGVVILYLNHD